MSFDPEFWPPNAGGNVRLVAVLVCEIRQCDETDREILLSEFLRAAWPTRQSQSQ